MEILLSISILFATLWSFSVICNTDFITTSFNNVSIIQNIVFQWYLINIDFGCMLSNLYQEGKVSNYVIGFFKTASECTARWLWVRSSFRGNYFHFSCFGNYRERLDVSPLNRKFKRKPEKRLNQEYY